MFHGRRSIVDMIVEFAISVVILMIIWLMIKVAFAVGIGAREAAPTGVFSQVQFSNACDYWLMSFLQEKGKSGISNSELLALGTENSNYKKLFETATTDYFTNKYHRSKPLERWKLSAETSAYVPIATLGFTERQLSFSCSQKIAAPKGPLTVTLGVDY